MSEKKFKLSVYISHETRERLNNYVVKSKGSLRGLSEVVEEAIREYLDKRGA